MARTTRWCLVLLSACALAAAAVLGGCGGGSGEAVMPTGTVRLVLTDVPAAGLAEMHVRITRIEISNRAEATRVLLEDEDLPDDIDLLAIGNTPMLLGTFDLREGRYSEVRVLLSDRPGANWVRETNGTVHTLTPPLRDPEGGTRLVEPFYLQPGSTMTLLLDFNAAASVYPRRPGEPWAVRPMIFAQGLPGDTPALGRIAGVVIERDGDPLEAPLGRILGVFIENGARKLVAVAEVCCDDGSFLVPRAVPGNHYLTVRFTTPTFDLEQTGDPLTIYTPGRGPTEFTMRVPAGGVTTPNVIIDL